MCMRMGLEWAENIERDANILQIFPPDPNQRQPFDDRRLCSLLHEYWGWAICSLRRVLADNDDGTMVVAMKTNDSLDLSAFE